MRLAEELGWASRTTPAHSGLAREDVEAQLLRLQAIIKKTEGFTNPVGFSIDTSGTLGLSSGRLSAIPGEPALSARPLPVSYRFGAYGISEYGSGATLKRDDGGETPTLGFYVNDLTRPLFYLNDSRVPEFEKLDVDVVRLAKPQPARRGERMPAMASTNRSHRGRPDASSSRPFLVRR